MPLETWSGQLHIVHGDASPFGPYAGTFHGPGAPGAGAELLVLVQPLEPPAIPAIGELLPGLRAAFEREALSLTGTLIHCIAAVHEQARAWNQKVMPGQRSGMAFTGLALRGDQAYLAQAGPCVSYLRRGGELRRITVPQEAAAALGLGTRPEPDFTYFALRSGDVFLLPFNSLERHLDQDAIRALLDQRPDRAVAALYEAVAEEAEFAAILLAVDPPEGTPVDLPPPPPRHTAQGRAPAPPMARMAPRRKPADDRQFALFQGTEPEAVEEAPAGSPASLAETPARTEVPPAVAHEEPPAPGPSPEAKGRPAAEPEADQVAVAPDAPGAGPEEPEEEVPAGEPLSSLLEPPLAGGVSQEESHAPGAPAAKAPGSPPIIIDDLAGEEASPESGSPVEPGEAAERLRRVRLRPRFRGIRGDREEPEPAGAALYEADESPLDLSPKVNLGRLSGPALRRRLAPRLSRRTLLRAAGVLAAVAIGVAAALALPNLLDENEEGRARELVTQAQGLFDTAMAEADLSRQREALRSAQALVEEALALRPDDQPAQELASAIRSLMATLNREVRLADLELATGLEAVLAAPGAAEESVIAGDQVYLLDGAAKAVVHFSLTEPDTITTVLAEGIEVGGVPAAAPARIAFLSSQRALLILASDGALYLFRPGAEVELAALESPAGAGWTEVDALVPAGAAILALDLGAGTARLFTVREGRVEPGTEVPLGNEAPTAIASAAWLDTLYVLDTGGTLYRLGEAGLERLELVGLDRPLRSPQHLAVDTANGHLYIADRGNNRVVVLDRDGVFKQQLVSADLLSLRLLAVDGNRGLIYLVAGDGLYRATLPALGDDP